MMMNGEDFYQPPQWMIDKVNQLPGKFKNKSIISIYRNMHRSRKQNIPGYVK